MAKPLLRGRDPNDEGRGSWRTPQWLFDVLDYEFQFTLDAAAAEENHLCRRYWTKEENALERDWVEEVVFCNPPYDPVERWIQKFAMAARGGATVVAPLQGSFDAKWYHQIILPTAAEVRQLAHRVEFLMPDGKRGSGNRGTTQVVIWHPRRPPGLQAHVHSWDARRRALALGIDPGKIRGQELTP